MADKNMNAKIKVEFDEAASRQSLNSGDSIKTLFGKIKKVISDLKAVAFSGSYTDLKDTPSIPTSLPANGGNADTVDGVHIAVADDAVAGLAWFAAFSDNNRISAVNPSRAYVGNAGNADTVDGLHGWYLGTLAQDGSSHGTSLPMFCQYNAWGDGRFGMLVSGYETRVHYATSADYAASAGSATSAGSAGSATYAYYAGNADPGTVSLKNMSVGTAAANASNCPSGAWYGQYT